MKKIIALLIMGLILAGCGNSDYDQARKTGNQALEKDEAGTEKEAPSPIEKEEKISHSTQEIADSEPVDATESKREEYRIKLKNVEKEVADLEAKLQNATQIEMNETQAQIFKKWDNILNVIYGVLEQQLSASEMNNLREEQREWIKQRDQAAEEEASIYKGGTLEPFQYLSTKSRITKERTYELVEGYMK